MGSGWPPGWPGSGGTGPLAWACCRGVTTRAASAPSSFTRFTVDALWVAFEPAPAIAGDSAPHRLHHCPHHLGALLGGEGDALACRAAGHDAVRALRELPLGELAQRAQVHPAVLHRGDDGDERSLKPHGTSRGGGGQSNATGVARRSDVAGGSPSRRGGGPPGTLAPAPVGGVAVDEHLGRARTGVVVRRHREAIRAGRADAEELAATRPAGGGAGRGSRRTRRPGPPRRPQSRPLAAARPAR